jgi:LysM repeat protein
MTPVTPSGSAEDYIETYNGMAISEMKRTGVPASITLAQGMIESGMGKGSLAVEANNHFGIKCHDNWDGPTVRHNDDRRNECFRKYKSAAESFRDHSDFLRDTPRYSFLFDLSAADYKGWARGLKKSGYATNPDYANMVIEKIEKYGLYKYDSPVEASVSENGLKQNIQSVKNADTALTMPVSAKSDGVISFRTIPERVLENNRIQYIIVNEKDTREKIEKEMNLLRWELPRYNEIESDFTLTPGQILYLQPKRDKAEPGKEIYIVKEGETMYLISQIYGIKIKKLYFMNRMSDGTEPAAGQKIWLRKTKPVD